MSRQVSATGLGDGRAPHIPHGSKARPVLHLRIGPLTLFVLTAILSLAVLAVLVFSTANSSFVLAQRQADAVQGRYREECAAQEFIAAIDGALAPLRDGSLSQEGTDGAVSARQRAQEALEEACRVGRVAAGGWVSVYARMEDDLVSATFEDVDGRVLSVGMRVADDGTYRIVQWRLGTKHHDDQQDERLYLSEQA